MITIPDALQALTPLAKWAVRDEVIEWLDSDQDQPTDTAIQAKIIELQSQYDGQAYARSRKAKYDLLNQFEMQLDDAVNGTATWIDAINAIKQEFPK
jgi:hypothetical protein